jgi:hypothetical protein
MRRVLAVAAVTVVLCAAAWNLAPPDWRWPALGSVAFFGIFIAVRIASAAIGAEAERRFNRPQ